MDRLDGSDTIVRCMVHGREREEGNLCVHVLDEGIFVVS